LQWRYDDAAGGRGSTPVYCKRKGRYIFHGFDDLITIQHQRCSVLLYGVQLMSLAPALGADRVISMSKDCSDCLRRVSFHLVKAF
jgi:hypothetical protein